MNKCVEQRRGSRTCPPQRVLLGAEADEERGQRRQQQQAPEVVHVLEQGGSVQGDVHQHR